MRNTNHYGRKIKRYEELTFTDDFMFCKIMQNNPELCKDVTELILGIKIGEIIYRQKQQPIEITADGKGVRFDIYMEDDSNTVYDIEMQTTLPNNLPKRMRYYQGMIDLDQLERGSRYDDLKSTYIIFICLDNPFANIGLHKYTFSTSCEESPALRRIDETTKVILSAEGSADDISPEMSGFLKYLTRQECSTALSDRLEEAVSRAREHAEWRMEYMTLLERDERMREEGRAEEKINTEREKKRADSAEKRADAAEKEIVKLKEQLAKLQNNT